MTNGRVLRIAVPMTLAYLSTPILGFVDTAVIGQLGSAALLGGVAVGAVLFDIVFTMFNFLRMGTTGLTAQALGAGDRVEVNGTLFRTLLIAAVAGGLVILLREPLLVAGLWFMGASAEVEAATSAYYEIRILSAPFVLANYAILGWFLGLGRAGIGLLLQTLLNGINMVLNVWFVLGLGWGVEGVAWGTLIGETVTAVVGLGLIAWLYRGRLRIPWQVILEKAPFRRLFSLNRDIMVRSTLLILVFAFFTAEGARQNDTVLAANAILMNFFLIAGYFLDGVATAAEQLVGVAIGARARAMAAQAIRLTLVWSLVLGILASLFLLVVGPAVIDFVTTAEEVRATARTYLLWAALTPIVGAAAFQSDGAYIGATWSREMRNWMLLSTVLSALTWWLLMPIWGNDGLWLALLMFLGARAVTMTARYPVNLRRTFDDAPAKAA